MLPCRSSIVIYWICADLYPTPISILFCIHLPLISSLSQPPSPPPSILTQCNYLHSNERFVFLGGTFRNLQLLQNFSWSSCSNKANYLMVHKNSSHISYFLHYFWAVTISKTAREFYPTPSCHLSKNAFNYLTIKWVIHSASLQYFLLRLIHHGYEINFWIIVSNYVLKIPLKCNLWQTEL